MGLNMPLVALAVATSWHYKNVFFLQYWILSQQDELILYWIVLILFCTNHIVDNCFNPVLYFGVCTLSRRSIICMQVILMVHFHLPTQFQYLVKHLGFRFPTSQTWSNAFPSSSIGVYYHALIRPDNFTPSLFAFILLRLYSNHKFHHECQYPKCYTKGQKQKHHH